MQYSGYGGKSDRYTLFEADPVRPIAVLEKSGVVAVAIAALLIYNYLQVRVGQISATYARSCERFVQALLYVESAAGPAASGGSEVSGGRLVPA